MTVKADVLGALTRYWGYESFRPLQERIVGSLLEGRDACVVMPTGGGKSLCYQLPAAMSEGKTGIVVSPLIALMQDQMAQLTQMGIPAAVLNSSLSQPEQSKVLRQAIAGEFRLVYVSPERLAREDMAQWLKQVPIAFFAIDEAHCISEWGHEFRPEYRQLSSLRAHFPDRPIAAFTASATRQVRHDIIDQLRLKNPDKYIASFHRPNLRYTVRECPSGTQTQLLLRAMRNYTSSNVIVYAPTIRRVEETVDLLEEQGIQAIGYHGKMDAQARRQNQEKWMSDEVRVLVGTIAFGLGINKAAVRAVIHLSLPKSIEQYYQEAGRAGRDGLAADCVLLWQKKDVGLLTYFIEQMEDPAEKERSWQRYHTVRRFVESRKCRHMQICEHFGEKAKWQSCGACDICGAVPAWLAEPVAAPRRKRRAAVAAAAAVGASSRGTALITGGVKANAVVSGDNNEELREYLREWRRMTAREQGIAAFLIMHDTSLEELCRRQPLTMSELRRVSGFGDRKTELYGAAILEALSRFKNGARPSAATSTVAPSEETARLLGEGKTFEEIANIRGRQVSSVASLVADLLERGEIDFQPEWILEGHRRQIEEACGRLGMARLKLLKEALPEKVSYGEIRIVVANLRRQKHAD